MSDNDIFQQGSASIKPLSQELFKDNNSRFGLSCKIKLECIKLINSWLFFLFFQKLNQVLKDCNFWFVIKFWLNKKVNLAADFWLILVVQQWVLDLGSCILTVPNPIVVFILYKIWISIEDWVILRRPSFKNDPLPSKKPINQVKNSGEIDFSFLCWGNKV